MYILKAFLCKNSQHHLVLKFPLQLSYIYQQAIQLIKMVLISLSLYNIIT